MIYSPATANLPTLETASMGRSGRLQRPEGATVDEIASAMGWQRHTVRGLFSGTLKKKLGLTLASAQEERGRVYRIAAPEQA